MTSLLIIDVLKIIITVINNNSNDNLTVMITVVFINSDDNSCVNRYWKLSCSARAKRTLRFMKSARTSTHFIEFIL